MPLSKLQPEGFKTHRNASGRTLGLAAFWGGHALPSRQVWDYGAMGKAGVRARRTMYSQSGHAPSCSRNPWGLPGPALACWAAAPELRKQLAAMPHGTSQLADI